MSAPPVTTFHSSHDITVGPFAHVDGHVADTGTITSERKSATRAFDPSAEQRAATASTTSARSAAQSAPSGEAADSEPRLEPCAREDAPEPSRRQAPEGTQACSKRRGIVAQRQVVGRLSGAFGGLKRFAEGFAMHTSLPGAGLMKSLIHCKRWRAGFRW